MSRGPHGSFSFSRPEETKAGGSLTSRLTMPPTSGERRWVYRNTDGGSLQSQKPCPNNVFSERETKGQRVKNRRSKKKKNAYKDETYFNIESCVGSERFMMSAGGKFPLAKRSVSEMLICFC